MEDRKADKICRVDSVVSEHDIRLSVKFKYDTSPISLLDSAWQWYCLATDGFKDSSEDFSVPRYIAFCFSIEFMLKALMCIDKNNAKDGVLKKYGHNLQKAKNKALEAVQDKSLKNKIKNYFNQYPEFINRDLIKVRYGELGTIRSYSYGAIVDESYKDILRHAGEVIGKECKWKNEKVRKVRNTPKATIGKATIKNYKR